MATAKKKVGSNKAVKNAQTVKNTFTIAKSTIHQDMITREDRARQKFNAEKYGSGLI